MEIKKYIEERLTPQRLWYENKASFCKKKYISYQKIVIILGAIIPLIVTAGSLLGDTWVKVAAFLSAVISAVISVYAGLDKLLQYQTGWYNYRAAEEVLKKEEWLYIYKVGPYYDLSEEDAKNLFVERIENTISADMARFTNSNKKEDKEVKDFIEKELEKAQEAMKSITKEIDTEKYKKEDNQNTEKQEEDQQKTNDKKTDEQQDK